MTDAAIVLASALGIVWAATWVAAWWDDRQQRLWDAREDCPDCRTGRPGRHDLSRLDRMDRPNREDDPWLP